MNILHTVEFYYPHVGGVEEVVRKLSEELVSLGHQVTVATTKLPSRKIRHLNGVKIVEFAVFGKSARGIVGEKQKYLNFVLNSRFDVITNFAAQQWATDLLLPVLDKIKAKKVFVPTGFSGLYSPVYKNYFQKMKIWMKKYDANIFLSNNYRDINYAKKNKIKNIKLIPNGASKKEFLSKTDINIRQRLNIPDNHFLILNVSSHTGMKGHAEAIKIFCKANLPNSTFLIIGKKTKSIKGCFFRCQISKFLSRKNIMIEDLTREETVASFKAANVFLFTSQVECSPLVLFESLAGKTPFLTFDVGNAREIIKWTKGGKLLPKDINKAAALLKKYYHRPSQLSKMGGAGHSTWKKKFTWEKIAKQYEALYHNLIHDRGIL